MAAVAGGLAGLYYGYESIPEEWLATIREREYLENLCNNLFLSSSRKGIEKLCLYIPYFEMASKESVCQWSGGDKVRDKCYTTYIQCMSII